MLGAAFSLFVFLFGGPPPLWFLVCGQWLAVMHQLAYWPSLPQLLHSIFAALDVLGFCLVVLFLFGGALWFVLLDEKGLKGGLVPQICC